MVAAAKIGREAVEKKNEQLRSQVKDTELLLASHQDQLAELKSVMQGMHLAKDDVETRTSASTAPPSPAAPSQVQGLAKQEPELDDVAAAPCNPEEFIPGPSCNFPQLLRMVCRTDLQAYDDFRELLVLSRSSKPPSRAGSGSYAGLNVMSLAGFGGGSASVHSSPTNASTHSPKGSLSSQVGSHIPLKETRFYKRVLMEDIEPTLRLDLAPGISWLTRRTVLSGICEGTLVVEPMPSSTKKYEFQCSVCGERRPGAHNQRTHRFRTSDSETAQRYSLCLQCLERIRSCCEFTGYLRLILDGHIRASDVDEERDAWEETVRLRERMFWSRIAGGIVPLVGRPFVSETEPDKTVPDAEGPPDRQRLHPSDNTCLEPKAEEMRPDVEKKTHHDTASSIVEPSIPDYDVIKPVTPDLPHLDRETDELSADEAQLKRSSVDSNISVYEEANADVVAETVEPFVDTHEEPNAEPHPHSSP